MQSPITVGFLALAATAFAVTGAAPTIGKADTKADADTKAEAAAATTMPLCTGPDDPDFSFNRKGNTCAWIAAKSKRRQRSCKSAKTKEACPLACGICSQPTPTPPVTCNEMTAARKCKAVAGCKWSRKKCLGAPTTTVAEDQPDNTTTPAEVDADADKAVAATCSKAFGETSKALDDVLADRYLSVGGKPLPNFESSVVAYAHYSHCKVVVGQGKPGKSTSAKTPTSEMEIMHFEHCTRAIEKIRSSQRVQEATTDKASCVETFPHLGVAASMDALGMTSAGASSLASKAAAMYDYGFSYIFFDYGFQYQGVQADDSLDTAAAVKQMPVDAMVAENFAGVLMRQYKGAAMTLAEQKFIKIMDGDIAKALNAKAFLCQN